MSRYLSFEQVYDYAGTLGDSIDVPIIIRAGNQQLPVIASVDTGASFCLFRSAIATVLGLDLTKGTHLRFRTANSAFEAYGHEVDIVALGVTTRSTVYFFADPLINKNVLGRTGWLDRVRLAVVHHDNRLYLSPYGEN
ncbi:hypothetical protein F183_A37360 [Bryobacterales bacterium F-183]|nr:hypothetical protein F183_A37360 [Bryobacterales bacterium F-183]